MRNFIYRSMDVLAFVFLFASVIWGIGTGVGIALNRPDYFPVSLIFPVLTGLVGFVIGVLGSGSALALTEIARNTRQLVDRGTSTRD